MAHSAAQLARPFLGGLMLFFAQRTGLLAIKNSIELGPGTNTV
jgi:hypothetical protein